MEAHGVIGLPPPTREAVGPRPPRRTPAGEPGGRISGSREDLARLRLDLVQDRQAAALWNEPLATFRTGCGSGTSGLATLASVHLSLHPRTPPPVFGATAAHVAWSRAASVGATGPAFRDAAVCVGLGAGRERAGVRVSRRGGRGRAGAWRYA